MHTQRTPTTGGQGTDDTTGEPSGGEVAEDQSAVDAVTARAASKPADVVAMVGYLGAGSDSKHRRLYESQAMEVWIEIPVTAIVKRFPAGGQTGRSMIWVRKTATVRWCQSVSASIFQEALGRPGSPPTGGWPRPFSGD